MVDILNYLIFNISAISVNNQEFSKYTDEIDPKELICNESISNGNKCPLLNLDTFPTHSINVFHVL